MATFLQLQGELLSRELGSDDTTVLFTSTRRESAINAAQLEFVKQTECYTKELSITLANGTQEYDLDSDAVLGGDFLWIASQGIEHSFTDSSANVTYTAGEDFPRVDIETLNEQTPGWRNTSSSNRPQSYYIREAGGNVYLGLYPKPLIGAGESAAVRVPYVAVPPDMSQASHEPFSITAGGNVKQTLRPWHQALVHYAAALLEPLRKNYAGEQRQRQLFAAYVADYLQRHRPKGGHVVKLSRRYYAEARKGRSLAGVSFTPRTDP